jgi:hypothetical protein
MNSGNLKKLMETYAFQVLLHNGNIEEARNKLVVELFTNNSGQDFFVEKAEESEDDLC